MAYDDVLNARKAALQARLEQDDWNSDVIAELAETQGAIGVSIDGSGLSLTIDPQTVADGVDDSIDIEAIKTSLADIDANTDGLEAALSTISGNVDGVEASLTTIAGHVDGLETSASSIATNTSNANTLIGAVAETAPASDTASSGLNGRLQRIAQRLTSLIALLPTSLGTKTAANSFPVAISSDGVIATRLGTNGDAASLTGSTAAQLREIGNRLVNTVTTYTHSSVSPTTSSGTVIASNANRKHLLIVNTSTTVAYIRLASSGATTADIPLSGALATGQAGGSYEINYSNLYTGAIVAITASGTATLSVMEGV